VEDYSIRKYIIAGIFIVIAAIYIIRLFNIQISDPSYKISAENNSQRTVVIYPARGIIYDRNGEKLVYNEAAYDLMVITKNVEEFDTVDLCNTLDVDIEEFKEKFYDIHHNKSRYKPYVVVSQITAEQYALLAEKMYKFTGFLMQKRTLRKYTHPIAAHVLGYIREVDKKITEKDKYYKAGDYIGVSGLEKYFEKKLRGTKGVEKQLVDVHNNVVGSFMEGELDTAAVLGIDIHTTLDTKLQIYGEKLMKGKTGTIVAIEPSTGEILTMVTSPSYDPNLLVGREMSKNYKVLEKDSLKPLNNIAIKGMYPPGSIFKTVQALVGLQLGVIQIESAFPCIKEPMACHNHEMATNVSEAIKHSCNPYFYQVFKRCILQGKEQSIFKDSRIGLKMWNEHVLSFGLGRSMFLDIGGSYQGLIPDVDYFDRFYGKNRWAFSYFYSVAIGQGEVTTTPLQLANLAAIIANRGYYYQPHFVKGFGDGSSIDEEFTTKKYTNVDTKYFEPVVDGMWMAVNEIGGTAWSNEWFPWGAKLDSIDICGKTGTVENFDYKIIKTEEDKLKYMEHPDYKGIAKIQGKEYAKIKLKNHSGFFAFAPKDDPKIAIAVYVEHCGFGGTWAAPIASLMIEKYLVDSTSRPDREKYVLEDFNKEPPW
jgi:penicillin-binding protein 2